jgi:hypothetical protein
MITANLYSALRSLRWRSESRFLWVDAICICQDDLEERGLQVALMRQIYQNATQTVVYLGDEADESFLAIAFLNCVYERGNRKIDAWEKKGPQVELLDSHSQKMHRNIAIMKKLGSCDVSDLEEGQNRIDQWKVAEICARPWGRARKSFSKVFLKKLRNGL